MVIAWFEALVKIRYWPAVPAVIVVKVSEVPVSALNIWWLEVGVIDPDDILVATELRIKGPVNVVVPAIAVLPVADATVNLFVLTSKLPSIPTAPLALIAAAVVVPVTPNVPAIVVFPLLAVTFNLLVLTEKLPVESSVPAISILVSSLALVTAHYQ